MRELIAEGRTVQSVVCDPPYSIGFMGKKWDVANDDNIAMNVEVWRLCYDLLPPGGHLLAFGDTHRYHRLGCAIEDAGFEIRDTLSWIYGQGFPKGTNVSVAIDQKLGYEREVISDNPNGRDPITNQAQREQCQQGYGSKSVARLASVSGFAGERYGQEYERIIIPITAAASPEAKQWDGWRTQLKPAQELICLARKPLDGTVAENVLKYGTGALNIDGCRIECSDKTIFPEGITSFRGVMLDAMSSTPPPGDNYPNGRWPANVIHDGSEEVLEHFPQSKGQQGDVKGDEPSHIGDNGIYGRYEKTGVPFRKHGGSGSAARFFKKCEYSPEEKTSRFIYCAKASTKERYGS